MSNHQSYSIDNFSAPGIFRRLAAILYDLLLLASVLLLATAVVVIPVGMVHGEVLVADYLAFRLYLLAIIMAYFIWPWVRGGQTLGMRSWRIRLVTDQGGSVTIGIALKRYLFALLSWLALGLGFIWIVIDPEKLAWHDRLSKTRLVMVAKK